MKTSIIVEKGLTAGQKANVASIIAGQLSLNNPDLYYKDIVKDLDGNNHAAIHENIVILEASPSQLNNLLELIKPEKEKIESVLFSKIGQNLSNSFEEYHKVISQSNSLETGVIGIGLRGEYEAIKKLTKKFCLAK